MSAIPQPLFSAQKAALDNILAAQSAFFGGFEKLTDLNLRVLKATLDEVGQKSQELVDARDAQDAVNVISTLPQPSAEKALAYSKQVYDIVSSVQGELVRVAEQQVALGQQQLSEALDQLASRAPAGSESAIALMKSSLATANSTFDTVGRATRQATEAAQANVAAATDVSVEMANKAAEAVKANANRANRRPAEG